MRRSKQIFFLILIFWVVLTKGQTTVKFQLNFENKAFELDAKNRAKVDSVLSSLTNFPKAYQIEIKGFSDNTGSNAYNHALSLKRAKSAANYFEAEGFLKFKIKTIGKGSEEPIADNATENGRKANRRIEVLFTLEVHRAKGLAGIKLKDETYRIKVESGAVLETPSATKILIPPGAFVDKKGKPVTGNIEILYREYREPVDFILGGIPMSYLTHGGLYPFNSAGMFKILAYKNGQAIYLKTGEEIKIDFAVTENLANLNFYRFDTLTNQWAELAKLTDEKGNDMNVKNYFGRRPCAYVNGYKVCTLDECQAPVFIVNKGTYFLESNKSLYNEIVKSDSLTTVKHSYLKQKTNEHSHNKIKLDSAEKKLSSETHFYKIKKSNSGKGKQNFSIECKAENNNEIVVFKDINWEYSSSINSSLFKKEWKECRVSDNNGNYSIVLKDTTEENLFDKLQPVFKTKVKKKERAIYMKKIFNQYETDKRNYLSNIENLKKSWAILRKNDVRIKNEIDSVNTITLGNDSVNKLLMADSLFCFWEKNKNYMSKSEATFEMKAWFKYFDENKPEMQVRINQIKKQTDYESCKKVMEQKRALERKLEEFFKKQSSSDEKAKSVIKSLSISELGIYNCDVIDQLKEPLIILADYRDGHEKKIEPLFIYVLDKTLNGMVRYDGYESGYGPKKFAIAPKTTKALIAVDNFGVAYLIEAKKLAEMNIRRGVNRYTFKMQKIDAKSVDEMRRQL